MHFQAETVVDGFVGRITDIDLRASLDAAEAKSVRTAWRNFPVLVFPRQHLEPAHLRRFGEVFGPPEPELCSRAFRFAARFAFLPLPGGF